MKKILIIEDDVNVLHGLEAMFRVDGFEVLLDSGDFLIKDIIHKIKIKKPDYIILDLVLPKVDGFELLNFIKSDEDVFMIPIFVFSDMSDEDIRVRCHNLGADYFFLKQDLNIQEFFSRVKKIIINRQKIHGK